MYLYIIHKIYRLYQLPVTLQSVPTFPVTAYRSIRCLDDYTIIMCR